MQLSYNPVMFGGHRDSAGGDIKIFVYHVTLQDHVIKGSCDFIEETIKISHHLAKFGCNRHSCNRDI